MSGLTVTCAALNFARSSWLLKVRAKLLEGRAPLLVAASGLDDAQRAVSLEGEALFFDGRARAFGRGRAGRDDDFDVGVCGERVFRRSARVHGAEGEPASRLRLFAEITDGLISGDLFLRRKAQARARGDGLQSEAFEHARGVHVLVELDEHQRVARLARALRMKTFHRRRRRGETESFRCRERVAERGLRPGGNGDGVSGRHRQPAAFDTRLEDERLRAEPTPVALRLWRHLDGDARRRLLLR